MEKPDDFTGFFTQIYLTVFFNSDIALVGSMGF